MFYKLVISFIIVGSNLFAGTFDINVARKLFLESKTNKKSAEELLKISSNEVNNNSAMAYNAIALFMMCNHTNNVYTKLSNFNKGKTILEKSISNDKENIELRFLRYCIQKNIPSILGYNNNLETDKAEVLRYLKLTKNTSTTDLELVRFLENINKL